MKNMTKLVALFLLATTLLLALAGCSGRFDYRTEDMTKYVTLGTDPFDIKFSVKNSIKDEDVYDNFNEFFNCVVNEDLEQIYKAVRTDEIFDIIQHELCKLLNIIP